MSTRYVKKTVEEWLNEVDYEFKGYMPATEALLFVNFIKEVNDGQEENATPLVHLKMMEGVFNAERRCAIMCHRGIGKWQSLQALILTDHGWISMKDICIGDKVFTRNGVFAEVDYKTPLQKQLTYEIELSDGTKFEVGEEHNHIVWMYRKKEREKILTTKELLSRSLWVATKNRVSVTNPKRRYTYSIPLAAPIQWPVVEFPIDPYALGYWIANGNSDKSVVTCHSDDAQELMEYFSNTLSIGSSRNTTGNTFHFYLLENPFKKHYGYLAKHKYIPEEFIKCSISQRTELLRGLMDGDGSIAENGGCSYSSYSKRLATDVRDLARSLGAISYIKEYIRTDKNNEIEYRTIINIKINPFRLKRKADRWKPTKKNSRAIVAIKEIGMREGHCIHVNDLSHSYITDGFTVTHNTSLFGEYLVLFIAAFGYLPGFGNTNLILYVTDSVENGVKNLRRNVEFRYSESEFLQKLIPNQRITMGTDGGGFVGSAQYDEQSGNGRKFTDIRLEFKNHKGHNLVVKGFGSKALSLDSKLYTVNGFTTIGSCAVGDRIFGADGKLTTITHKSEVFNKPMYRISLCDGRTIKVSEDHLNPVVIKENPNNLSKYKEYLLTTKELLELPLFHTRNRINKNNTVYTSNESLIFIKNCEPLEYPEIELPIDPYSLGVILGDGRIRKNCGSVELTAHINDFPTYLKEIPYTFGKYQIDTRNANVRTQSIRHLGKILKELKLNVHGDYKHIPAMYLRGSIAQRLALLSGLMDTDGTVGDTGRTFFSSNSKMLTSGVAALVRSLGGTVKLGKQSICNDKTNNVELWLNLPMFRLERKLQKQRYDRKANKVGIISIEQIATESSQCIAVDNDEHQFITDWYIRTHNTGVRGAKELGKRPTVAILDDLVSDTDAESATVIKTIENTIYKAVSKALSPTKQKIIWLGTPFNARDPLYKAVESGAWNVSVYPICNEFPVEKKDFKGSWEDRFTYQYVKDEYDEAQALGMPANFNQELMLRIMSEDDRLIMDSDIGWYKRSTVLNHKSIFNFYITTDFATSEKTSNDFSVISVWALNNKGYWFWVDGVCKKQLMNANIDDLFRLAQKYNPQSVGIEVSGQQGGFISWIQEKMIDRNIWFNLASNGNTGKPGIRPNTNKMVRFNIVVPLFKANQIFFPIEMKNEPIMQEMLNELTLASPSGFKSKRDDCGTFDTIVDTPKGGIKLGLLKDGDSVFTYKHDQCLTNTVKQFRMTGVKKIYNILLEDGTELNFSAYHPILTTTGYVLVKDLSTHILIRSKLCKLYMVNSNGLNKNLGTMDVPSALQMGQEKTGYISLSMKTKLALFRKGMKYITEMVTKIIIQQTILFYCRIHNTEQPIKTSILKTEKFWENFVNKIKQKYKGWSCLQKQVYTKELPKEDLVEIKIGNANGVVNNLSLIAKLKKILGTVALTALNVLIGVGSKLPECVLYVIQPSYLRQYNKEYVAQNVLREQNNLLKPDQQQNNVLNVDQYSLRVYEKLRAEKNAIELEKIEWNKSEDVELLKIAKITIKGYAPTYNFEVDVTHNYSVENGIIVHNCIDTISMLGSLTTWRPSEVSEIAQDTNNIWDMVEDNSHDTYVLSDSYIV